MSRDWYYVANDESLGPVNEESLHQLVRQGQLKPADLVWTEGMPEWLEASSQTWLFGRIKPGAAAAQSANLSAASTQPTSVDPWSGTRSSAAAPVTKTTVSSRQATEQQGAIDPNNPYAAHVTEASPTPVVKKPKSLFHDGDADPILPADLSFRVVGNLIDSFLFVMFGGLMGAILFGYLFENFDPRFPPSDDWQAEFNGQYVKFMIITQVVFLIYYAGLECSALQATLGKWICGLHVTNLAGHRISVWISIWRHILRELLPYGFALFGYLVSDSLGAAFLYFMGSLLQYSAVFLGPLKQTLHDLLSGTVVNEKLPPVPEL